MAQDGNLRDEEGHVLAPRTKAANVRTIDTHGSLGALNGVTNSQALLDSISLKTKTLIGNDANKSVRTIANEQIVATIIAPNPKASLDTLQEIAAWIQSHPDDAAAMNREINTIKNTTIPNLETSLNNKIKTINNTTIPNLQTTLTNNINKRIPYHTGGGLGSCSGSGSYNYCKIATFKIKATYVNRPITMEVSGRGRHTSTIQIIFASANNQDPGLSIFDTDYDTCFWLKKTATSTWALYFQYSESWGNCVLHRITGAGAEDVATITINMENVSAVPSGSTQVSRPFRTQADIDAAVAAAKVGNAVVGDVLSGKTFTNASTSGLTGNMPNRGAVNITLYTRSGMSGGIPVNASGDSLKSYTIPNGYHNGSGTVKIVSQDKTVRAVASSNVYVRADSGKVLETVTVQPQSHSGTFVTSENKANVNMGENHNYRYVDTRNVYSNGYNAGNEAGTAAGYTSGYNAGNTAGYNSGYSAGKNAGYPTAFGWQDRVYYNETDHRYDIDDLTANQWYLFAFYSCISLSGISPTFHNVSDGSYATVNPGGSSNGTSSTASGTCYAWFTFIKPKGSQVRVLGMPAATLEVWRVNKP